MSKKRSYDMWDTWGDLLCFFSLVFGVWPFSEAFGKINTHMGKHIGFSRHFWVGLPLGSPKPKMIYD